MKEDGRHALSRSASAFSIRIHAWCREGAARCISGLRPINCCRPDGRPAEGAEQTRALPTALAERPRCRNRACRPSWPSCGTRSVKGRGKPVTSAPCTDSAMRSWRTCGRSTRWTGSGLADRDRVSPDPRRAGSTIWRRGLAHPRPGARRRGLHRRARGVAAPRADHGVRRAGRRSRISAAATAPSATVRRITPVVRLAAGDVHRDRSGRAARRGDGHRRGGDPAGRSRSRRVHVRRAAISGANAAVHEPAAVDEDGLSRNVAAGR